MSESRREVLYTYDRLMEAYGFDDGMEVNTPHTTLKPGQRIVRESGADPVELLARSLAALECGFWAKRLQDEICDYLAAIRTGEGEG